MYDVDYFIKKFEAIPEDKIISRSQGEYNEYGCAYGWCRTDSQSYGDGTEEGKALRCLMSSLPNLTPSTKNFYGYGPYESTPARINNGDVEQYQQPTPKQRILAALHDIKKLQNKDWVDKTIASISEPEVKRSVATVAE